MQMNIPKEMATERFSWDGPVYEGGISIRLEALKNKNGTWYFEERWPDEKPHGCHLNQKEFINKLNTMRIPHALSEV